ncbi:MAG: PDZ domain-containing protein [Chloroflexi bacterium]|nr:PDZ domain-containing protein [Chloroflexota bacterium]
MGWQFDDFDLVDGRAVEIEEPPRRRSLAGFVLGALIGGVTLVVIAALVFGLVGMAAFVDDEAESPYRPVRSEPSAADLRNANYRPSEWQEGVAQMNPTPTALPSEIIQQADLEYTLLSNLYQRVNPSVVNIEIVSSFHSNTDIIDSSGSGFVFDGDGYIVTNAHVVRDADEVVVTFSTGHVVPAEVVGLDDYSDLAVIKVDPADVPLMPLPVADSNLLDVGQRVIAIGNPFGLDGSMTTGIISALGRSLPSAQLLDQRYQGYNNPSIIQIDAAVNPGNSGGPLLNSSGEVVGVNTAIRTENGGFQGIAFAVPSNTLMRIVPQLIETGSAQYSWLGISSPSSQFNLGLIADELNLPVRQGVLITEVFADSPAARAGLQSGDESELVRGVQIPVNADIIVAINGNTVNDINDLVAYLVENTSPEDVVTLTIVRSGQTLDLDVTLGVRP